MVAPLVAWSLRAAWARISPTGLTSAGDPAHRDDDRSIFGPGKLDLLGASSHALEEAAFDGLRRAIVAHRHSRVHLSWCDRLCPVPSLAVPVTTGGAGQGWHPDLEENAREELSLHALLQLGERLRHGPLPGTAFLGSHAAHVHVCFSQG